MRALLLIALKDLRQRFRDGSLATVGILAPLGLALIITNVTAGLDDDFAVELGVVDLDQGAIGDQLAAGLEELGDGIELHDDLSEDEAGALVADGEIGAAIVIPEGFSEGLDPSSGQEPVPIRVLRDPDEPVEGAAAQSIAEGLVAQIDAVRIGVTLVVQADPGADPDALAAEAQGTPPPISVSQRPASDKQLDAKTYVSAGLSVFFAFFLVQFGVRGLLDEQRDGTMARLLVAPIPHWAIPAAKAVASVVMGTIAIVVLAVASTLLMGADWGDPAPVALLIVTVVAAAVSIMGVVAVVATSSEQASNAQTVIAVVLGLLGGSFFQVSRGEGLLAKASLITPHNWFIEGLGRARVDGLAGAWWPAAVLVLFAVVVTTIGAVLPRRRGLL